MAKATFSCSKCGTDVETVGRNRADADRRAEWAAKKGETCSKCWRAARDAERAANSASAAERNAADGLPSLSGTPKQIAWAESIRANTISALKEQRDKVLQGVATTIAAKGADARLIEEARDAFALIVTRFRDATDAKTFIEQGLDDADEHAGARWVVDQMRKAILDGAAPGLKAMIK